MEKLKKYLIRLILYIILYFIALFVGLVIFHLMGINFAAAQGFHIEAEGLTVEELRAQFEEQENLGAKLSRYQIFTSMRKAKNTDINKEEYLRRVGWQADTLEQVIQDRKLFILISLHDCPVKFPDVCIEAGEYLYNRFNPYYRFIGIDPNEPSWKGYVKWAQRFVDMANKTAPYKFAFIESFRGSPSTIGDLKKLRGNFIPSVHVYYPFQITHQGVLQYADVPKLWGRDFTKKNLENYLKPVINYQKATGKNIYIGEFNCVRWSGFPKYSNAEFWIRDAISIFKKHNWSWTFLSFRGSEPWSAFKPWNRNNHQEYPTTWVMNELIEGMK